MAELGSGSKPRSGGKGDRGDAGSTKHSAKEKTKGARHATRAPTPLLCFALLSPLHRPSPTPPAHSLLLSTVRALSRNQAEFEERKRLAEEKMEAELADVFPREPKFQVAPPAAPAAPNHRRGAAAPLLRTPPSTTRATRARTPARTRTHTSSSPSRQDTLAFTIFTVPLWGFSALLWNLSWFVRFTLLRQAPRRYT